MNLSHFSRPLLLVLSLILILSACAKREVELNVNLAGNRKMGVTIHNVRGSSQNLKPYFSELLQHALQTTYGAKTEDVPYVVENAPLEDPENLFAIGSREIDDYFLVDVTVHGNFTPPPSQAPGAMQTELKKEDVVVTNPESSVEISGMIYNGANLRAVTMFKIMIPTAKMEIFERAFNQLFKHSALQSFSNPNIYPKSDPEHFGNLLYNFSLQREKDSGDDIDCDKAVDVLKYYPKADQLFKIAMNRGSTKVVGQESASYQIAQKREDASSKAKILESCKAEQGAHFEIQTDFGTIGADGEEAIKQAIQKSGLSTTLAQYTSKPVKMRFQVETNGDVSLFVTFHFERARYTSWIAALKVPQKIASFQILSLDPYRALMQKMVFFRSSLPPTAPTPLKNAFQTLRMQISMTTILNGEIAYGVDGTYFNGTNILKMKYPNTVIFTGANFPSKGIANRNDAIFQDRGWIALGNCKTIEGTLTEDGLVYRFFGLPCH